MVELNASGDIFGVDATAGFNEGVVRGKVVAESRLSVEGEFDICHGLKTIWEATATAEVTGQLGLLWLLSGRAEGQARSGVVVSRSQVTEVVTDMFRRRGGGE